MYFVIERTERNRNEWQQRSFEWIRRKKRRLCERKVRFRCLSVVSVERTHCVKEPPVVGRVTFSESGFCRVACSLGLHNNRGM